MLGALLIVKENKRSIVALLGVDPAAGTCGPTQI